MVKPSRRPPSPSIPLELVAELDDLCVERERGKGSPEGASPLREQRILELQTALLEYPQPTRGSVLAGARLEQVIQAGTSGTVWRATGVDSGLACAVKVFHLHCAARGRMLRQFRQGISALSALKAAGAPPLVVQFLEADGSQLAFSMALVAGRDLTDIARRGWAMDKKLQVFSGVCEAVRFAHQRGLLHGGIRPANVLYDENAACPVVTDFDAADVSILDATTAIYAAPEQRQGRARLVESDIYSLGRLLEYLITEAPPVGPALSVREEALARIILTCTRDEPAQRYGDVEEIQSEVRRWRTGQGVNAARQSTRPPTPIPPPALPVLERQERMAGLPWGRILLWCAGLGLFAASAGFAWENRAELGWGTAAVLPARPPDAGPPPVPAKKKSSKPKRPRAANPEQGDQGAYIPSEAISRLFRDNGPVFQRCHSNPELPVTELTGRVLTNFKVNADGVISEARLVQTTVKSTAVARCIAAAHNGLRLRDKPGSPASAQSQYEIAAD